MKILFISAWLPYPPINGAKIRIYNLIRQLSKIHEITLLSFVQTIPMENASKSIPELSRFCQSVKIVPFKHFDPNTSSKLRGFFSLNPRFITHTYSSEMANLVDESIASDRYDLVIASEVGAPSVASYYAARITGIPKILDAIEVAHYKDAYENMTQLRKRIRNGLTWFKYKRFTREVLLQSDAGTVPSEQEKQNLEKIIPPNFPIEVIPHCLDLDYYKIPPERLEPQSLVFTGSFSHYANFDAVRFFLDDMYPYVRKQKPDVNLKVIGSTNSVEMSQLKIDNSITFTGLLNDVRSSIARSWVSVVPLRVGAGTRLKIIESMALGTPVVSTSKGAEGLDVTHGENILIADNPDEFVQAVVAILESPSLREKLSSEGLRLVSEKYSAESMGEKFQAFINALSL